MHPTSNVRRRIAAGVLALSGMTGATALAQTAPHPAGQAAADPADVKVDARTGALIVPLGGVVKFAPPGGRPIRDITNRNEDVLDARVDIRSPSTIVLAGKRGGATQLTLVVGAKDSEIRVVYDVVVQPDFELLKSVIRRAVPTATVDVIPGPGSAIILTGFVSKPEDTDIVLRIASDAVGGNVANIINSIQVGGSQQVLIDVTIAQVNRSELRQRGFDFGITGTNFGIGSTTSGLLSQTPAATSLTTPIFTNTGAANIVFGIVPGNFLGALQALRNENLGKILSEPKVVTQSGRPAFLRSGGQQAVVSPAAGITGPGAALVPFGTELEVLPIVYGNGRIYLEVNPRFSAPTQAFGITINGSQTPGFTEQQSRSSVMMESGQTFAIGGLIERTTSATSSRIPVLGDLPFVGTAFSRVVHNESEQELIFLVTPRLVEPLDCSQAPRRLPGMETRSPDDYELFLEGLLEAPRGQRQVWTGKRYNAAYKCDPTYGKYPASGRCVRAGSGRPAVPRPAAPVVAAPVVVPVSGTGPAPVTEVPPPAVAPVEMAAPAGEPKQ